MAVQEFAPHEAIYPAQIPLPGSDLSLAAFNLCRISMQLGLQQSYRGDWPHVPASGNLPEVVIFFAWQVLLAWTSLLYGRGI